MLHQDLGNTKKHKQLRTNRKFFLAKKREKNVRRGCTWSRKCFWKMLNQGLGNTSSCEETRNFQQRYKKICRRSCTSQDLVNTKKHEQLQTNKIQKLFENAAPGLRKHEQLKTKRKFLAKKQNHVNTRKTQAVVNK